MTRSVIQFPKMDGHRSWTDAMNDPRVDDDLRGALDGFRGIFGDGWLGWVKGVPFTTQFFLKLQNQQAQGVRLWRMVQGLREVSGVREFVRNAVGSKAWREYLAAAMTLEFCSRARAAGGDAQLVQRDQNPTPDTRLRIADRWITTEMKALHDRDEMNVWYTFEEKLHHLLAYCQLPHVAFDREWTDAALENCRAVADGLISIAARGIRDYEPLPRGTGWARLAAGNTGKDVYPIAQKDDLSRLVGKMREWSTQLVHAREPTLLVVRTNALFGDGTPTKVGAIARKIASALNPLLRELPMIGAVLIYEEPFWAPRFPVTAMFPDLRVRIDTSPAQCARFMTLVPNGHASEPLQEAELDRLVGLEPFW